MPRSYSEVDSYHIHIYFNEFINVIQGKIEVTDPFRIYVFAKKGY